MTKSRKSFKLVALMLAVLFTASFVAAGRQTNLTASADDALWTSSYESKQAAKEAGAELNLKIAEEGMVLLKNDGALPIDVGTESKVTLFGLASYSPAGGGSSGGDTSGGVVTLQADIVSGIQAGGFVINPTVAGVYADWMSEKYTVEQNYYGQTITTEVSKYASDKSLMDDETNGFDSKKSTMEASYSEYSTAIVTFADGSSSERVHSLQLDAEQYELLDYVTSKFSKVIVLINSSNPLEIGKIADNEKVDAILLVGEPGDNGFLALGKILNGSVNPSGRTTDTWAADFTKDPTYCNYNTTGTGNGYSQYIVNGETTNTYFVDYEEGIYVGYRYYETRGYEEYTASGNYDWYDESVVYPFGYGLSYTQFQWSITPVKTHGIITENDVLKFEVTVKNVGDFAGKDVVQLYYTTPYYEGKIEKAHVVLGDFVKTPIIAAGETLSFPVELSISVQDMASYDYADANNNEFKGYELDDGDYVISIARKAHDIVGSYTYKLETEVTIAQTENADGKLVDVINSFDDVSAGIFGDKTYSDYTSRSNFATTVATKYLTDSERTLTAVLKTALDNSSTKRTYKGSDEGMPWKVDGEAPSATPVDSKLSLRDMLNDPDTGEYVGKVDYDDARWETLLNELSLDDMKLLVGYGAFRTVAIEGINGSVSKPLTNDGDGPSGFTSFISEGGAVYDTCFYQAECVMGATWNVELAQRMGELIGEEGLAGNERGDGLPYSGWYAPAVNIHRSPFGGRNWEYYSEDGLLSGKLAAKVCLGTQSKGVYTYVKHFAVNDQETDREMNGILVWCNEQAVRELYLKPFEIAVKEGKTSAMMSSFNRLGMIWAGGSYSLLTEILCEEWGFKGMVITDYSMNRYTYSDQMIRAGGDLFLTQDPQSFNCSDDATQITLLRKSAKNVLYTIANNNAMSVKVDGYKQPLWQSVMIIIDVAIFLICSLWGVLVILKSRENLKK